MKKLRFPPYELDGLFDLKYLISNLQLFFTAIVLPSKSTPVCLIILIASLIIFSYEFLRQILIVFLQRSERVNVDLSIAVNSFPSRLAIEPSTY